MILKTRYTYLGKNSHTWKTIFLLLLMVITISTMLNAQSAYRYEAVRLPGCQPAVSQEMFTEVGVTNEGENMNGPSLIRIPDWIAPEHRADPEAQYYLYFAHHDGGYIRMAWAKEIDGPWNLYRIGNGTLLGQRGVMDFGGEDLHIGNGISIEFNHMASPDVHVDHENQRIIMYFHTGSSTFVDGKELKKQLTYVTESPYGLDFYDNIKPVILGGSYFRVFEYDGNIYALTNDGTPCMAPDPNAPWTPPFGFNFEKKLWIEHPGNPFQEDINAAGYTRDELRVRHTAVRVHEDNLHVFYSRRGELIERVQWSLVPLKGRTWDQWDASYPPMEIISPEPGWEGGELPSIPSETSAAPEDVKQLRDPCFFEDTDGSMYLGYTGRGEDALGIAALYFYENIGEGNDITDLESTIISGSNDDEPWISETEGAGSPPEAGIGNLTDNDNFSVYAVRAESSWIEIAPINYTAVTGYTLTFADNHPTRDPKIMELLGYDDKYSEWVNLHAIVNYPLREKRFEKKSWILDDTTMYSKFRFRVHSINGDPNGMMQLAELELFGTQGGLIPVDTITTDTTSTGIITRSPGTGELFHVYPNPAENFVIVENLNHTDVNCTILSMNGSVAVVFSIGPRNRAMVDISDLEKGIYILKIQSAADQYHHKIIIS